jgi:hypothetical protein
MVSLPVAPAAERISLPKLAKEESVSPVSAWRWAMRGVSGERLPTFCIGNKRFTTRDAFQQWCARVTAARNGVSAARISANRESEIDRAEKRAAELGV